MATPSESACRHALLHEAVAAIRNGSSSLQSRRSAKSGSPALGITSQSPIRASLLSHSELSMVKVTEGAGCAISATRDSELKAQAIIDT